MKIRSYRNNLFLSKKVIAYDECIIYDNSLSLLLSVTTHAAV